MKKSVVIWISGILFVISLVIMISSGIFNGWIFLGLMVYLVMYFGGWLFVRYAFKKKREAEDIFNQDRHKFHYCWERANLLLKKFPGGRGIEWSRGHSSVSTYKTYWDGEQNKPYRSMVGFLEKSKRLILIIYDIDSDDIKEFVPNPAPEKLVNHFLGFRPFSRNEGGMRNPSGRYGDFGASRDGFGMGNQYIQPNNQYPSNNQYNQPQQPFNNPYQNDYNNPPVPKETVKKGIGSLK